MKIQVPLHLFKEDLVLSRRKWNGNGNGNGHSFKIGRCPVCEKENIPLTEHHIYKRAVFGDNEIIVYVCRDCHDKVEVVIREMENAILRAFIYCYRKINKGILSGKTFSTEQTMETVLQGFRKINERNVNPWLEKRIRTKAVSVGSRGRKKEQN